MGGLFAAGGHELVKKFPVLLKGITGGRGSWAHVWATQSARFLNHGTKVSTTLQSNGISMPQWTAPGGLTAWNGVSASYTLNSSGDVSALIGQGLRNQSIWNTTERVLLNINPNVTSITTFTVNGATAINRVFEWGSLFSGLFSAGQGTSNIVKRPGRNNKIIK